MENVALSVMESALREQILDSLTYLVAGLGEPLQSARTWIVKRTCKSLRTATETRPQRSDLESVSGGRDDTTARRSGAGPNSRVTGRQSD